MNPESDNIQPILDRIAEIVWREMEENYRLFLFGSRASDGHDSKADIDIGILADKPVEAKTMVSIKERLEQIPTLLKIDFVDFSSVSQDFRKIAMKKTKDMIEARNLLSHTYNENQAIQVYRKLPSFLEAFNLVLEKLNPHRHNHT